MNNKTTDEERAEMQRRYKESRDWAYIFEPIKDVNERDRLIDLFNYLEKN